MKQYTYSFSTKKSPHEVFELLLKAEQWWSGIFEETITGESAKIGDEFSFSAGGGMHFSKQKLETLIRETKIVWQVTESHLAFLENPKEWENTKLTFDILKTEGATEVTFSHEGLSPDIECYDSCSNAWSQYLPNFKRKLNG